MFPEDVMQMPPTTIPIQSSILEYVEQHASMHDELIAGMGIIIVSSGGETWLDYQHGLAVARIRGLTFVPVRILNEPLR